MAQQQEKKKVPIKEGVFDLEKSRLIGSRCKKCGDCFHPKRAVCANCYSEELEEVLLGTRGKLSTYTIARTSYPWTPLVPPFITAQVKLPEDVLAMSLISDCDLDAVRIGMDVELYFWKVREDEEGNEVMAYAFKPITA